MFSHFRCCRCCLGPACLPAYLDLVENMTSILAKSSLGSKSKCRNFLSFFKKIQEPFFRLLRAVEKDGHHILGHM